MPTPEPAPRVAKPTRRRLHVVASALIIASSAPACTDPSRSNAHAQDSAKRAHLDPSCTGPGCAGANPQRERLSPTQSPRAAPPERSLGVRDSGIFPDLDPRVQLTLPPGLSPADVIAALDLARQQLVLYAQDWPLKVYPLGGDASLTVGDRVLSLRPGDRVELAPLLAAERLYVFDARVELPPGDADDDGIPDPLDLHLGALKTALNADRYDGRYVSIGYPGGDVPREMGVCTDVIIRALRNIGRDLQRELQEDLRRTPRAYPMIGTPNPVIDHRRVKSLLPLFERHYSARSAALDDPADPLRPGDIVFMDTFPDRPGAEHVGILSVPASASSLPLVINNWTDGTVTRPMELLSWVPVTQRFRVPARLQSFGPISALKTQLITVVAESFAAPRAELRRYVRAPGHPWRAEGSAIPVVLGHGGLGWGDGLHGVGAPAKLAGPTKREGDGRSPAGAFELGRVYGYAETKDPQLALPYRTATESDRCVDDPESSHYNQIRSTRDSVVDWRSAEQMRRRDLLYDLAIEIAHNRAPVVRGHGSCIFIHAWAGPNVPVTGCTGMDPGELRALSHWLQPNASVLVALPRDAYRRLSRDWSLP